MQDSDDVGVTRWINAVRRGDEQSANELWNLYFRRLIGFARSRMGAIPTTTYDEEDAAISSFRVLCEKLQAGDYPEIADRNEFWQLLVTVAARKIKRRAEYEFAAKRGGGSILQPIDVTEVPAKEATLFAVEYESLFNKLADPNLERVASLKIDGYTNEEIAKMIHRTRRTVQRMLDLIRDLWREELIN